MDHNIINKVQHGITSWDPQNQIWKHPTFVQTHNGMEPQH
jgi:hypothetical protein